MKTEDFKKIIRSIVQEELKNQLPSMIPKILSEVLANKTVNYTSKPDTEILAKPKEYKQYVKNPKLNDVLNETIVKIKTDNTQLVDYSEKISSEIHENINIEDKNLDEPVNFKDLNEGYASSKPIISNIKPVSEEQAKVLGKINRDFRGLMKSIDAKRKNGSSGIGLNGVSMDSGNYD